MPSHRRVGVAGWYATLLSADDGLDGPSASAKTMRAASAPGTTRERPRGPACSSPSFQPVDEIEVVNAIHFPAREATSGSSMSSTTAWLKFVRSSTEGTRFGLLGNPRRSLNLVSLATPDIKAPESRRSPFMVMIEMA